ncbi:MAG: preprotein translocase subunit TatB [Firmicutes bacterium]|nr:preprotein translocase subunit TatB [Bacillota bacterium]
MNFLQIDARGRSCPEPVLLTKKAVEKSPNGVVVIVDNPTARDNVTRFGKNGGYNVDIKQDGPDYILTLSR